MGRSPRPGRADFARRSDAHIDARLINMTVGSLTVRLLIREARTLKDKRQVVRSILA